MSDRKSKLLVHFYINIKRYDARDWPDVSDGWNEQEGCPLLSMNIASYFSKVIF